MTPETFKPFDLRIRIPSKAEADFILQIINMGIQQASGHGGFSSKNQGKALVLLRSLKEAVEVESK